MKKKLVILTTHFGTNFSGGSTATCEIFTRMEDQFQEIVVIGTQLGEHTFQSLRFIRYSNWWDAIHKLKQEKEHAVFYGDFYNSLLFILAKVPFYFTYHDNWPELSRTSLSNRIRSSFYTNIYKLIFRKAVKTITVSAFKQDYIRQFTDHSALIRNGFKETLTPLKKHITASHEKRIIMVGNIDQRKYGKALELFQHWFLNNQVSVHIYGNVVDHRLSAKLERLPFVTIAGFSNPVPYSEYDLLLHTSAMENLPIVFCEALYYDLPVVGFDVGGSREIIDGANGILVPPYDLKRMKEAIEKTLGQNSSNLNKDLLKNHSWDSASQQYRLILTNN